MKIKGWMLKQEARNHIIWENIYPKSDRYVLIVENVGGVWQVTRNNGGQIVLGYPLKNKYRAKKIAINYMRKHPKG